MKIILATAFPADPEQPSGGVEAVSVVLARALAREPGLQIEVVTADARVTVPERVTWAGVTVNRVPWPARRILTGAVGAAGAGIARYVAGLEADVVHAHDTYGIMLQHLDAPKVLTIHGFIHADTAISGERWARARARLWRTIEHRAWARYPRVISISPYVRERITPVVTGVIHDIDNPTADTFFNVPRQDTGDTVFCAATISPRKNTVGLIEAFARVRARHPRAKLRLAGPHVLPAYSQRVHERILALGIADAVTILPPLGSRAVRDELAGASVMALLSLEENSPLSVQEAMAAGVPVVTSNRCGMPYQVADGETGFLVHPGDPAGAAACIGQLLTDAGLRLRMGLAAQAVATHRFHPAAVARRTRHVYAAAAGARISSPGRASQSA